MLGDQIEAGPILEIKNIQTPQGQKSERLNTPPAVLVILYLVDQGERLQENQGGGVTALRSPSSPMKYYYYDVPLKDFSIL